MIVGVDADDSQWIYYQTNKFSFDWVFFSIFFRFEERNEFVKCRRVQVIFTFFQIALVYNSIENHKLGCLFFWFDSVNVSFFSIFFFFFCFFDHFKARLCHVLYKSSVLTHFCFSGIFLSLFLSISSYYYHVLNEIEREKEKRVSKSKKAKNWTNNEHDTNTFKESAHSKLFAVDSHTNEMQVNWVDGCVVSKLFLFMLTCCPICNRIDYFKPGEFEHFQEDEWKKYTNYQRRK